MSTESLRVSVMDAQRYDLSRHRMPSTLSIKTKATSGHADNSSEISRAVSDVLDITTPWADHTLAILSNSEVDDASPSDTEDSSSDSLGDSSTAHSAPLSTLDSSTSITLEEESLLCITKAVYQTDVFDRGDFITTRTIIRPAPRNPIFGFFSRPSSPILGMFSRPSSPVSPYSSRSSSPLGFSFSNLNCLGGTDNFEDEVTYLQASREKEIAVAENGLNVRVLQEHHVQREEKWREGVQAMLYGQHSMAAQAGYVEVV